MRPARDIIADHMSTTIPPSRSAFNRADNLIRALEGGGYQIVRITRKEPRPFVIEDRCPHCGADDVGACRKLPCNWTN